MRIGLYTWGSEGDVRPFVALASGLVRAGHDVWLGYVAIDGRDWTPTCEALGVRSRSIGRDAVAKARATPGPHLDALVGKGNALSQVKRVVEALLDPMVEDIWADAQATLDDLDVVVAHPLMHPAMAAAVARRLTMVTVQPAPVTPTRRLPPMGAPDLGPLNALSWKLADVFSRGWLLPRVNAFRARAGVAPKPQMFPREDPEVALSLTCVSPTLVARPDDWGATQVITGFLDLPSTANAWSPPPGLDAFFDAGEPPVWMTFGSMLAMPGDETTFCVGTMIEAAKLAGCRAIVQAAWAELPSLPESPRVFRLGHAPHATLLPRCAAMVHHGGAGTTQAACLAGRPSVVVPFLADQFFWADRLRSLGVAPRAVRRRGLTARALARAIREILASPTAGKRAADLSAAMKKEDGVAVAVELIGRIGSAGRAPPAAGRVTM